MKSLRVTARLSSVAAARFVSALALSAGAAGLAPLWADPPAHPDTTTSAGLPAAQCDAFVAAKLRTARADTPGWSRIIVRFTGSGLTEPRIKLLSQHTGGYVYRRLPLIKAAAFAVPTRNLPRLASVGWVKGVSEDATVIKEDIFTVEHSGSDAAYEDFGLTGRGVGVAVLDTGVRKHSDFSREAQGGGGGSRLAAAVNFAPDARSKDGDEDDCGHGTHVAGIVAGNGRASSGPHCYRTFLGVARAASVVSVRVLDGTGQGNVSTAIRGIEWAIANRGRYNIRVLNISFGHDVGESYQTDPLCLAVRQAWEAGIVVVCAAGNSGRLNNAPVPGAQNEGWGIRYGSIQCPGNSPYVITVGAMKAGAIRAADRVASYSSRGPTRLDFVLKPDLVAPGDGVISLLARNASLGDANNGANLVPLSSYRSGGNPNDSDRYLRLSGTSMAAPVVAGAAALLLEQEPGLSPDSVKARLMLTADKWVGPEGRGDVCTFGAGYLNIPAALASPLWAGSTSLSPALARDTAGNVWLDGSSILMPGDSGEAPSVWGTRIIRDLQAIWGGNQVGDRGRINSPIGLTAAPVWTDISSRNISDAGVDLSNVALHGDE